MEAINSYAKLKQAYERGEIDNEPSLPKVEKFTVRMNYPRVISIFQHGKEFPFFFKVKLNGGKRVSIPVECGDIQKEMLIDALNDNYKVGAIQLVNRNNWFYFVVPLKKEAEIKKDTENVVGVDLGLRHSAVITSLQKEGRIGSVEFKKYHKLLDKVRYLWKEIRQIEVSTPRRTEDIKANKKILAENSKNK